MSDRRGFTLLELVIVVALLAAVAVAAVAVMDQVDDQSRFELTRARAQQVRDAVVGPGGQLNGSPVVQGFVADMGRLPASLDELVEPGSQPPFSSSVSLFSSPAAVWSSSFGAGWRGPYVTGEFENVAPMEDTTARLVLRDGWGNVASGDVAASPDLNFGWLWSASASSGITLTSLGSRQGTGWDAAATTWTIVASDYLVDVGSKTIRVTFTAAPPASTRLRIYFPATTGATAAATYLQSGPPALVSPTELVFSTFTNPSDGTTTLPIGTRSLLLWNTDVAVDAPLAGSWMSLPTTSGTSPAYPVVIAPRVDPAIPTLAWGP
jgi:prepilin-type N-terminal cleavage/methylation domain-containing protein